MAAAPAHMPNGGEKKEKGKGALVLAVWKKAKVLNQQAEAKLVEQSRRYDDKAVVCVSKG